MTTKAVKVGCGRAHTVVITDKEGGKLFHALHSNVQNVNTFLTELLNFKWKKKEIWIDFNNRVGVITYMTENFLFFYMYGSF